jgi:hypothetical protein
MKKFVLFSAVILSSSPSFAILHMGDMPAVGVDSKIEKLNPILLENIQAPAHKKQNLNSSTSSQKDKNKRMDDFIEKVETREKDIQNGKIKLEKLPADFTQFGVRFSEQTKLTPIKDGVNKVIYIQKETPINQQKNEKDVEKTIDKFFN